MEIKWISMRVHGPADSILFNWGIGKQALCFGTRLTVASVRPLTNAVLVMPISRCSSRVTSVFDAMINRRRLLYVPSWATNTKRERTDLRASGRSSNSQVASKKPTATQLAVLPLSLTAALGIRFTVAISPTWQYDLESLRQS